MIVDTKYMLIQSHYNQKGIFEKIIRSKDGQLVRIFFEVYEVDGAIKGHIIKAEPILALARAATKVAENIQNACTLLLCAPIKILSPYFWNIEKKITSPFSELHFLSSIKIRAPAL